MTPVERLKKYRLAKNLSNDTIRILLYNGKADLTRDRWLAIEAGTQEMTVKDAAAMSKLLNMTATEFEAMLLGEDQRPFLTPKGQSTGELVRAARKAKGWCQLVLAAEAEVEQSYVSDVERNKIKHPRDERLQRIANALEVPLTSLRPPITVLEDQELLDDLKDVLGD